MIIRGRGRHHRKRRPTPRTSPQLFRMTMTHYRKNPAAMQIMCYIIILHVIISGLSNVRHHPRHHRRRRRRHHHQILKVLLLVNYSLNNHSHHVPVAVTNANNITHWEDIFWFPLLIMMMESRPLMHHQKKILIRID